MNYHCPTRLTKERQRYCVNKVIKGDASLRLLKCTFSGLLKKGHLQLAVEASFVKMVSDGLLSTSLTLLVTLFSLSISLIHFSSPPLPLSLLDSWLLVKEPQAYFVLFRLITPGYYLLGREHKALTPFLIVCSFLCESRHCGTVAHPWVPLQRQCWKVPLWFKWITTFYFY